MVVSCCPGGQAGQGQGRGFAHRLRQRMKRNIERKEKLLQTSRRGVLLSLPCLPWLIRRLARCWLEQDERRVDDKRGGGAEGPPERLLNRYVRLQAYVVTAVTGLGYLALTWSTVVLLGGFVTSLGKTDFWCLTVISAIQAAKIFDTLQDDLLIYLLKSLLRLIIRWDRVLTQPPTLIVGYFYFILGVPINMVIQTVVMLYLLAPFVGIIISALRLRSRDYGTSNSGDNSTANLTPALDIYYVLILLQGAFYLLWYFNSIVDEEIVQSLCRRRKLCENWGKDMVSEYHFDTRRACSKEPASLGDRDLITYAVGLVESESRKEYMSGARLLTTFIKQGEDVRSLLLLSRPKIQKLIDTLGWRGVPVVPGGESQEIRLLVAKIVADVAGNIHLAQFPGAPQCIASLFEEDEDEDELPPSQAEGGQEGENETSSIDTEGGTYYNKLIREGLTILEKLATNHHNCRIICNTPSLLSVITEPIYSDTLIKDIEVSECSEVAYRCFKVFHQLIRSPGWTGRRLRREVSSSNQAVSNLEKILDPDTQASQELQMGAMEILTEMALDLSVNLAEETKENLITRQLRIFLAAGEGGEDPTAVLNPLKIVAGRTLAFLSSKSERNSLYIIRERDDNAVLLTEIMFDANTNIVYKITAAEILVNLCTHTYSMLPEEYVKGTLLPEEYVKGTLLPKVLTIILSCNVAQAQQPESSQRNMCNCFTGICGNASQGDDVENQLPNHNTQNQLPKHEFLESLLSLTLLIYDKMIYVDGFDAVFQEKAPADQLVASLKTIVEENCKATSVSLRIVKLCGQIAISMMQRQSNRYIAHFREMKFVEALSKASGIMSKLESCVLVTGTNSCRMRKNARPLLSHLEKKVRDLVC